MDTGPGNGRKTEGGDRAGDKGESVLITWQSIMLRREEPQRTMELCRYRELGWRNKCDSTAALSLGSVYLSNTVQSPVVGIAPGLEL